MKITPTKRWSLSWHPHTKECRYGWYHNRTRGGGLWMQLNIPLLGDFGLWQHWRADLRLSGAGVGGLLCKLY